MNKRQESKRRRQLLTVMTGGVLLAMTLTGCASSKPVPSSMAPAPAQAEGQGIVALVNPDYRFVVVDFGGNPMPPVGTKVDVYRGETKVGTLQITEPVRPRFATADIVEGELTVGDAVR